MLTEAINKEKMLDEIYIDNKNIIDSKRKQKKEVVKKESYPVKFYKQCLKLFFE